MRKRKRVLSEQEKQRREEQRQKQREKRAAGGMASVEELALALGIGRNQAYEAVKEGKIKSLRFGRRYLIARATIAKLLAGDFPATA
jgi:excisionase family DNA binding protein